MDSGRKNCVKDVLAMASQGVVFSSVCGNTDHGGFCILLWSRGDSRLMSWRREKKIWLSASVTYVAQVACCPFLCFYRDPNDQEQEISDAS